MCFTSARPEPIVHVVGGLSYEWHADNDALQNIMGIVLLINSGVPVPDPRPWISLKGSSTSVSITHAELIGLGAAIAARKYALFVVKKAKQAEIAGIGYSRSRRGVRYDTAVTRASSGW